MTKLLEEAFSKATEQCPEDQDLISSLILEETDHEKRWDEVLAKDPEKLRRLAGEARAEEQSGKTAPLDLSEF